MPDPVRDLLIRIRELELQKQKCLCSATYNRIMAELESARVRLKQLQNEANLIL